MTPRHHSSRPADCVLPRPHTDPSLRFKTYGKVQPMDHPLPLRAVLMLAGQAVVVGGVLVVAVLLFYALTGG